MACSPAVILTIKVALLFTAYVACHVVTVRYQYHRDVTVHVGRQKHNILESFSPGELKKCEFTNYTEVLMRSTSLSRVFVYPSCVNLCSKAKEIAALRQQHTEAARDTNIAVWWLSVMFEKIVGKSASSSDQLQRKPCLGVIQDADKTDRAVDNFSTFLLVAGGLLMYACTNAASSILFETFLAVRAIDHSPISAILGAMFAVICRREVKIFEKYFDKIAEGINRAIPEWLRFILVLFMVWSSTWLERLVDNYDFTIGSFPQVFEVLLRVFEVFLTLFAVMDTAKNVLAGLDQEEDVGQASAGDQMLSSTADMPSPSPVASIRRRRSPDRSSRTTTPPPRVTHNVVSERT